MFLVLFFITCFCFGLVSLHQFKGSSPQLQNRPHSCEKGDLRVAPLTTELGIRMGGAARRGSAPAIDTRWLSQHTQLPTFLPSSRSISPAPTVPEEKPEVCANPSDDPSLPLIQVSSPPEQRRLSDTCLPPAPASSEDNLSLPAPTGRRHSDLSVLLSLGSKHNHNFTNHKGQACQACLSLLLRSRDGGRQRPAAVPPHLFCPCDEASPPKGGGRPRGSSDCSDFSLLQQSLFNIICRKAAPSQVLPPLQLTQRPPCNLKTLLSNGSMVTEDNLPWIQENRLCRGEQLDSAVAVGLVRRKCR